MSINKLNHSIRQEFVNYRAVHYQPSNKVLARVINISYSNLMQWQKGNIDLGYNSLAKIKQFLDNHKEG